MTTSTGGRERIEGALREELFGPAPTGKPLDVTSPVRFPDSAASYGPWHDEATGEEILERDPLVRYGVGVLYPESSDDESGLADQDIIGGLTAENADGPENAGWGGTEKTNSETSDDQDFDLAGANELKPSAMGISFLLTPREGAELEVTFTGGRYRQVRVEVTGGRERTWWARSPMAAIWRISAAQLSQVAGTHRNLVPDAERSTGLEGLSPRLTVNLRPHPRGMLVTTALTNQSTVGTQPIAAKCLFQTSMTATPLGTPLIPYPEPEDTSSHPDDRSFRLIYRSTQTYAVGHGCAATWEAPSDGAPPKWAAADPLPAYEVPRITPDIRLPDGTELTVSMAQLAGLEPGGTAQLERVLTAYAEWIGNRSEEAAGLDDVHRETATDHVRRCSAALERMREGLALIASDEESDVAQAFRLANAAMLRQQLRSVPERRETVVEDGRIRVMGTQPDEVEAARRGRGRWRAFQIAFLLASLPSTADRGHPERDTVDLIFFPTGGGKTEAYLGLSAFAMLLRRLRQRDDASVTVLMRYTLRLLTTQQFLRAAALICALEDMRLTRTDLGQEPFSIGIWVGSDSTPNYHRQAVSDLQKMLSGDSNNPFLLLRCPWCAAQMGPVRSTDDSSSPGGRGGRRGGGKRGTVAGYEKRGHRVAFICPDRSCRFSTPEHPLPVYVVDDDVYEFRPSLVIGTVDKFALLAWRPEARSLFGFGDSGKRQYSPPELVIQDELHLIAGPLGSMAGLYESVIEELCTDYRREPPAAPKIVASTATIRRHEEQIKSLYGRERVNLFPPHGINAEDSFFAVYERDRRTGELLPGRKYIGVHAPALGSMQTVQVRSFAALLQAAQDSPEEERDPWWTLMVFFNSLRELGNSLSLMQSDIPDYLKTINNRSSADRTALRYLNRVEEMTSRLRQDQIPQSMEKLSTPAVGEKPKAIDACLASSLIEVGIDIDRLSLMTIVGQPKSTSQYIQVTGRVGRRADTRPGLVVTLYGAAKPRDRSHFERFRSYHQRLYAQVEPTSATPFSPPALDRALHAVLISYIRQTIDRTQDQPYPVPQEAFDKAAGLLRARAAVCDPDELGRLNRVIAERYKRWNAVQPTEWGSPGGEVVPNQLLRPAGQYVPEEFAALSWPTPTSMRGADAECRAKVTHLYAAGEGVQQ
ncbi:helicase-related protein [Streptomyces alboflavus]|uniref:helicase-related protein n=1 Tax=Streptomyces alboflavus TaxID=67267 RepID=UPI0007C43BC6|nr:helicase-related protein [Streptomyces alboflavus]